MTMSPGGPPRCPRPPCPFKRIFDPVSTPEGTVMINLFLLPSSPAPPHAGHRTLGTPPLPRHIGHGRFTAKPPWPNEIVPRPPHSGHAWILAPLAAPEPPHVAHSSFTSSSIGTLPPGAAERNGVSSVVSTLCPGSGPVGRCARPPPNIELKRSPSPPSPPTSKSSNRNPPPGAPAPGRAPPRGPRAVNASKAPSRRISSYCRRFFSSPSTWYASEISLNRSAALASFLFRSG